jgi:hypothetical protein
MCKSRNSQLSGLAPGVIGNRRDGNRRNGNRRDGNRRDKRWKQKGWKQKGENVQAVELLPAATRGRVHRTL